MASREQRIVSLHTPVEPVCRHAINGLAPRIKMCAFNYECAKCSFDQMLDDLTLVDNLPAKSVSLAARAA
jgi:hypothetical protein